MTAWWFVPLVTVYPAGVGIYTRLIMRWWMNYPVCARCRDNAMWCSGESGIRPSMRTGGHVDKPRAEISDRNGSDALGVAILALLWPVIVVLLGLRNLLWGLHYVILHSAPLTDAERDRAFRRRQSELDELTATVKETSAAYHPSALVSPAVDTDRVREFVRALGEKGYE